MRNGAQIKDLLLPVSVVSVVGMMVFPLPSPMLDTLLMLNIAFSLCLLVSAVYLAEPERFTSLPTILLFSTLFRLGLNVSTTRQLLATGEAPDIVGAFGDFVVSGNLIVGAVVFIIITLVQFLVIAKGAERVAEVAARFTLDAMPGKQMSIDADIRAGIITVQDAKEKRAQLHRESKLFGALDGAMKFVKGDAIAGLLITIINISAGLLVGVTQQGMSVAHALERYTIFTIGDGLVSQIPALLVAVAAGIAVTRVSDKEGSFVGRDIIEQLSREPQALATTGVVLLGLSFVPGLSTASFLILGTAFALIASRGKRKQLQQEATTEEQRFSPKVYSPVMFRMSSSATQRLQAERQLPRLVQRFRNEIFELHGVVLPDVQYDLDEARPEPYVDIIIRGVFTARAFAADGESLSEAVVHELKQFVNHKLELFVDDTQTRMLLDVYQSVAEDLINSVIPEVVTVTALTTILRQLVRERVSIKEFPTILQAIAEYQLEETSGRINSDALPGVNERLKRKRLIRGAVTDAKKSRMRELLAEVRARLSRTITAQVTGGTAKLSVFVLDSELDQMLVEFNLTGATVPPNLADRITYEVERCLAGYATVRVVAASSYARSLLASLLSEAFPDLAVIAPEELSASVEVTVVDELRLPEPSISEEPFLEEAA